MRLRQIALVSHTLEAAAAEIAAVLGLGVPYADPGVGKYGLHNAVFPVGDTFLEIVSPTRPGTTAGRLLDKRGGDGGYMVILQARDAAEARARIAAAGARIADQADIEGATMTHIHPKDIGGAILSLDTMHPPESWAWGGPDWQARRRTERSAAITGAELQATDPAAMAARWGAVLGRLPAPDAGGWRIGLDGGELRFVEPADARGEGLRQIDVAVHDRAAVVDTAAARGLAVSEDSVRLCGTWVRLK